MSLFRAAKWRNHPMLQISKSSMLFGLPTGIVMFATVVAAEATGLIKVDAKSVQRTGGSERPEGRGRAGQDRTHAALSVMMLQRWHCKDDG